MKVLIVGGPNRGQVVDVEVTPSNMLELVEARDRVRGNSLWFKVEADVQDKHGYVMREIARAYEYVTKDAPPATQVTATDLERIAADFEKDSNLDRYICCNGRDCGCQGATAGAYAAYKIRALAGDGK